MKSFFAIIVLLIFSGVPAQNNSLLSVEKDTVFQVKTLYFSFDNLSFIKDNEYFNLIADGYTLLGNKSVVKFHYSPDKHYRFYLGFEALQHFGTDKPNYIVPVVSLQIKKGKSLFVIGRLITGDNHRLPASLYDFERLLDKRSVENGLQHRYKGKYLQTDTWLDWERYIYPNDSNRVRLNFGVSAQVNAWWSDRNKFSFPVALYLHHRGGQINRHDSSFQDKNNAMVLTNALLGLQWQHQFTAGQSLTFRYEYLVHSINSDQAEEFVFTNGWANCFQGIYRYKHWFVQAGYWKGNRFVSSKGDAMFQSVSRRVERYVDDIGQTITIFTGYTEPNRSLLTGAVWFKKEIYPDLFLRFNADLYYQLNKGEIQHPLYSNLVENHLDYSLGLYLIYRFGY